MKILVCISVVPDTTTKIKFNEGNASIDITGIQWIINPWDELSLTRALELKDEASNGINLVTVIHVGTAAAELVIRKALAIGADDAIRVDAEPADAYFTAAQIAEVVKKDNFDIILCGIESSDFNGSIVGGMIAEFLEIPSVSAVSDIRFEGGKPVLVREIDGGKESVVVPVPFVAVVQKGIAKEPRIAAMRGIMTARTKPVKLFQPAEIEPLTQVVQYEKPAAKATCKFIDAEEPHQLITLLQNEAKII